MNYFSGLPLLALIVTIVKVQGQACPEGVNVAKMCVPGTYSGERVLIDTASYDPAISNCSCTFGTNSSVMKLVTYVAPNYPECNSAIRLYSSSGNSIRFQCLMSGTYLDTSQYNAGVATFETYADYYDKNYCLVLEIAGRIDDTVTVSCTADVPEMLPSTTMSSAHHDNTSVTNKIGIESNTTDANIDIHQSTASVDITTSIEQTTKQAPEEIPVTTSMPATVTVEKISSIVTESAIETTGMAVKLTENSSTNDAVAVDVITSNPTVGAVENETLRETTTTGAVLVDAMSGNSTVDNETTTAGVIGYESKSGGLTVESVVAEALSEPTTAGVKTTEAVPSAYNISSSNPSPSITNTINSTTAKFIPTETTSRTSPHELDILFTSSVVNNIDNSNDKASNVTVDNLELFSDNKTTSNVSETKPYEDLSTLVTGTVLFNRGGTGLSKTIQNIDSIQADVFNDKNMVLGTSTYKPETTDNAQIYNSDNSLLVSKDSHSNINLLSNSNVMLTTLPTDISNSLIMGTSSSFTESEITNISGNSSDVNDSNYSLQFPVYDQVQSSSNQSTENTTGEVTTSYSYNTHNENSILFLDTKFDGSSDINTSFNETNDDNNTLMHIEIPNNTKNNLSVNIESSTFQNNAAASTAYTEVTNNAFQTSPYITNEARLILESSEPTDIIPNMPIKTPELAENTTNQMPIDFLIQNFNRSLNNSEIDMATSDSNVTDNEVLATTLSGFQVELTDSTFLNRSEGSFPAMNNQTATEANVPALLTSNLIVSLANETNVASDSINNAFNRNFSIDTDPQIYLNMTSSSEQSTPRTLDSILEEQLKHNVMINDTDIAVNNTFPESQESNFTEFTNVVFDKRNTFESTTYALPAVNVVENSSDIYTLNQNSNITEVSNDTTIIVGDSNERHLQETLLQNNMSVHEVNVNESTTSSLGIADTYLQDNINFFAERAVPDAINQTVDELSALGNATSGSYINQPVPLLDQEAVVYADTTSSAVDISIKSVPIRSEESHLSFINRMSEPYFANLTDTTPDIANEIIDNVTDSHIGDIAGSTLNDSEAATVDQNVFVSDGSASSFNTLSNETSHVFNEKDINQTDFFHSLSESASEINITENTITKMPDVITENDNMTHHFVETVTRTDYNSEMTQILPNSTDQGSYSAKETTSSSPLDVQTSEATPVQRGEDIEHLTFVHRLSEPVSEVNVTENTPIEISDAVSDSVDNLTFIHQADEALTKTEHIPEVNLTQIADQGPYLASETTSSDLLLVQTTEATQLQSGEGSASVSDVNITVNAATQIPDIVTESVDSLTFIQRFDEPLIKKEQLTEINLASEITTKSLDVQATEGTPVQSGEGINHLNFVHRLSDPTSEENVTVNIPTQISNVVTEGINNLTFINRVDDTLTENNLTQFLTNTVDQESFLVEKTVGPYQSDIQSSETTPTERKVSHFSFDQHLSEAAVNDIMTESTPTPFVMTENVHNTQFINLVNDNLLSVTDQEISTVKTETSSSSSNLLESTSSDQTTVIDKAINEYMIDSSIDQHNVLSSTDTVPFDNVVKSTTQETPNSTNKFIATTAYTFEKDVQTEEISKINESTTIKPAITSSLSDLGKLTTDPTTSNFDDKIILITEAAPVVEVTTEAAPVVEVTTEAVPVVEVTTEAAPVVEEIIVKDAQNILSAVPENIASIQNSPDSNVPLDVSAEIEKQIISDVKQSTPMVPETSSISTDKTKEKLSTTSVPNSAAHDTTNKNITVNEPDLEPINPKISSNIEDNIPTTPKQSFDMVEDNVQVEDSSRTVTDTPSGSGMNIYFDTGKSKTSAFDMNNDTYIIVVGAIVGLVVLAVVIGIFCHNGRKRRSEKVNISGNNAEAPNHQNQAFDNEAVNDIPEVHNGGGSPEVNGSASAIDVNNGNVEL